ncbi:hypothetical protein M404DRAFT_25207 [Pisolithus tinctorius Marx 270]|uniref:Uncharacterized protein n=1 Tax=Pisolithus tinctorius Marx 270 TaxID=870435 RepID=A0A0C3PCN3_PISTI|nr:hypothetical protein M404DRAFT_25207 [Pisolithus tinctorius Marx 270]
MAGRLAGPRDSGRCQVWSSPTPAYAKIVIHQHLSHPIHAPPRSNMKKITLQATEASRMERRGMFSLEHPDLI